MAKVSHNTLVSEVQKIINDLTKERDHWKANHDNMVARNQLLLARTDLPVDRLPAYHNLVERLKKHEEASPKKTDWCPTCKQGWNLAKSEQEARQRYRKAVDRITELEVSLGEEIQAKLLSDQSSTEWQKRAKYFEQEADRFQNQVEHLEFKLAETENKLGEFAVTQQALQEKSHRVKELTLELEIAKYFHKIAVRQRDFERLKVDRLTGNI